MSTKAQKRAKAKYLKEKTKQVMVKFYPGEKYLYEYLSEKENKAGYIKSLIKKDMENQALPLHVMSLDEEESE